MQKDFYSLYHKNSFMANHKILNYQVSIDLYPSIYKIIRVFILGGVFMAKKLSDAKTRLVGITIRVDMETNRILSAILSLKGMTLSGFLQDSIKDFIRNNYEEAKGLFDISRIEGLTEKDDRQK
jgi:hypothetical protein